MTVTLNTIRYHTEDTPYHYTYDNNPLSDLESNDVALKAAIDSVTNITSVTTASGSWSGLTIPLDLSRDSGKPFVYKIKIFAVNASTVLASQSSALIEDLIQGYSTAGVITVLATTHLVSQRLGALTLVVTYTPGTNLLTLSFSGYTATSNAYIQVKAERFGI